MVEGLIFIDYAKLFGFLILPIAIFAIGIFISIILSNRMGRNNKLIVFLVRLILVGGLVFGLFYYFYYFVNFLLIT